MAPAPLAQQQRGSAALTLRQDIVKLMFEMTNASECHRDAVFVCGGARFVFFDGSAETGD